MKEEIRGEPRINADERGEPPKAAEEETHSILSRPCRRTFHSRLYWIGRYENGPLSLRERVRVRGMESGVFHRTALTPRAPCKAWSSPKGEGEIWLRRLFDMRNAGKKAAKDSPPKAAGMDRCGAAKGPGWNSRWAALVAGGLIALATLAAYANSFSGPFVFDDQASIVENKTIQHLWPIWKPLCPPSKEGQTVGGRPLVNLSLAVDYAISGLKVWSYHATNLLIHILAALALFGILRRTFLLPAMRDRWGAAAVPLALCDSAFVGGSSLADRVGDICHSAGRVAGRTLLSLDAILLCRRGGLVENPCCGMPDA